MSMEVTEAQLNDYILTSLAKQTGRSRGYWRRAVGSVIIDAGSSAGCNWHLEGDGSDDDAVRLDPILSEIRAEFPFVVKN